MNVRKFISASICASMLACFCGGCSGSNTENEMEESTMQNTGNTTAAVSGEITAEEIPTAVVDNTYYAVAVDGNTINMDAGTVYRGLGVITGNNSPACLWTIKPRTLKPTGR